MTRLESRSPFADLNTALLQITADFGKWQVLSALLRHLMVRKTPVAMLSPPMSDHMRKDIGLPVINDRPPRGLPHWI
ncbi:hypothetical protein [Parasedimentitalea psychrophila]|uniref:Uncharacterized protein n=1 Tax=Parasedimentitalea psychrophila TaxID=2997337 RepID=A0A9Y2P2N8_9RHOB|nr:hypothetical protein [Parasedimentitalea psychrophila]WIY23414.1 hypothetical protein QPJ95_12140 [Parasedimentitalea psychrophila]